MVTWGSNILCRVGGRAIFLFSGFGGGFCFCAHGVVGVVEGPDLLLLVIIFVLTPFGLDTTTSAIIIHRAQVPILVRERSGRLFRLHVRTARDRVLGRIGLSFNGSIGLGRVRSIGLCCNKARDIREEKGACFTPMSCVSGGAPKGALTTGASCSILGSRIGTPGHRIMLGTSRGLFPKIGCF